MVKKCSTYELSGDIYNSNHETSNFKSYHIQTLSPLLDDHKNINYYYYLLSLETNAEKVDFVAICL